MRYYRGDPLCYRYAAFTAALLNESSLSRDQDFFRRTLFMILICVVEEGRLWGWCISFVLSAYGEFGVSVFKGSKGRLPPERCPAAQGKVYLLHRSVHTSAFATLLHGGHLFAKLDIEVFTIAHILRYTL